jgi:hypothetical protein
MGSAPGALMIWKSFFSFYLTAIFWKGVMGGVGFFGFISGGAAHIICE